MRLIDIVNLRSIILNQKMEREKFWNTIYDLLGKQSCCSPKSQDFKDSLVNVRRYLSHISPMTLMAHIKLDVNENLGFLIINLDKEMKLPIYKGREFRNVIICVTSTKNEAHDTVINELVDFFGSLPIDDVLENSKSRDYAFYQIKKHIVDKKTSELLESEQFRKETII